MSASGCLCAEDGVPGPDPKEAIWLAALVSTCVRDSAAVSSPQGMQPGKACSLQHSGCPEETKSSPSKLGGADVLSPTPLVLHAVGSFPKALAAFWVRSSSTAPWPRAQQALVPAGAHVLQHGAQGAGVLPVVPWRLQAQLGGAQLCGRPGAAELAGQPAAAACQRSGSASSVRGQDGPAWPRAVHAAGAVCSPDCSSGGRQHACNHPHRGWLSSWACQAMCVKACSHMCSAPGQVQLCPCMSVEPPAGRRAGQRLSSS